MTNNVDFHPALLRMPDGVKLQVKVVLGASRNKFVGILGERIKVVVSIPPKDGRANQAVCDMIARTLNVIKHQVRILAGQKGSHKTIAVTGLTPHEAVERLRTVMP